jgi:aspartate racemase
MKTMGLLAGMSWESSSVYYQLINRGIQQRLGGVHSAKVLMYSFDFGEVSRLQQAARWDDATTLLSDVGQTLAKGAAGIPLLHIADPLGDAAKKSGMRKLGLIGTRFTMDEPRIIADRLRQKFGLEVILPDAAGRETIDSIIQTELVKGVIRDESRVRYRAVMAKLVEQGAEAIILGCTEIPLLVSQADASVPLYDTMQLHAAAIVDFALS